MKSFWVFCLGAALCGCTSLKQYRTDYTACTSTDANPCPIAAIVDTPYYTLGFVEFDDQGWLWDREQMTKVVDRVRVESTKQPLLLLVYVHGWKHNAAGGDLDITMFRQTLREIAKIESYRNDASPRKVVGVYAGWRGKSVTPWALRELSFWGRKDTAHAVGQGALLELLTELDTIRKHSRFVFPDRPATKLVVVGHSFGGAALYSAIEPLLMERMVDFLDDSGVAKPVEGFGDLVVLINPAFEAARYKVLQERAVERSFFTNQFVTLAILTAENDSATGFWFPLGRTLGTLFDAHRNGDQRRMNVRVPGRCSDLVTHDLTLKTQEPKQTKKEQVGKPGYRGEDTVRQSVEQVAVIADVRKRDPGGVTTTPFSQVTLNPRSTYKGFNPLYNVRVDQRVIDGHGGIGHEKFITFLREFVIVNTERPTPSETK